jgi:hypothetical protein
MASLVSDATQAKDELRRILEGVDVIEERDDDVPESGRAHVEEVTDVLLPLSLELVRLASQVEDALITLRQFAHGVSV